MIDTNEKIRQIEFIKSSIEKTIDNAEMYNRLASFDDRENFFNVIDLLRVAENLMEQVLEKEGV